ncbi:MAG TPA: flagellin [Lachnospiraceae bacterium]|nr:flagellin [Lachnospiraceae bacterium]
MRIQNNAAANNALGRYSANNNALSKNLEKLSSGYRINRAGDDAAGLAISEKMRSQITGLEKATDNANDGISLVQTAEGALTEVHSMLNRMTELATQSANGTYDDETDRANLQEEVDSLLSEIDRISESTNYNGINLLDGSIGGGKAGSADGVVYTGANIADFDAAEVDGVNYNGADFTTASIETKDTFIVDGQKLEIDWSKGDAKTIYDALVAKDGSATETNDSTKDLASKLTDLFNSQMEEQGLSGSVKITAEATTLNFASVSTSSSSEFSYAGTDLADTAATDSLGGMLFGKATTATGTGVTSTAKMTYSGEDLATGDTFQMEINGTTVEVALTADLDDGDTLDDTASTAIQTAIGNAVADYNTQLGLVAGTKDTETGLTGLTATDFTAEFSSDGQLIVKYDGDVEDVKFSFSDIGDKTIAASLGLGSGSSKVGGGRGLNLQIGDTSEKFNSIAVSVDSMSSSSLDINNVDISTQEGATNAIDKIKAAINSVSSTRGNLGAIQNRLEHTINNLTVTTENITEAESRIRDVDMAKEMTEYTQNNILSQASQAMLAQANQLPQGVLQLLQ